MPIRTNEFQRVIAVIQSHLDPGSTVTESAMLTDAVTGNQREVDVVVSGRVGGQAVTVSMECRDRSRGPDVTWVDEMQTKHSRLPTNVLVLVSHRAFTPEALRVARVYDIRCHVLDNVDPTTPDRLFPDVRSLWGKGWQVTIDRVDVSVGTLGELPPEHFRAKPDTKLFLDDSTEFGSAAQFANALFRSPLVIDTMNTDARPEHGFVELVLDHPVAQERPICMQKIEPLVLRPIERFRVVARCTVTVDEFPLRHGVLEGVRVAWGTGTILGRPAMLVATRASAEEARVTLRFLPGAATAEDHGEDRDASGPVADERGRAQRG